MKTVNPLDRHAGKRQVRGVTLIELMVAMTIGLVLTSAMVAIYANTSVSNMELEKSVRQIDNGRYAMDFLGDDIKMAGYYGELQTSDVVFQPVNACATALANLGWSNSALTAPVPVTGFTSAEAAALGCLANHRAGTPALAVRHVETTVSPVTAVGGGLPYLQTSRCRSDPVASQFVFSNAQADFVLRNQDCSALNGVSRYVTRVYYVANCDECGIDTIPTLKLAELTASGITVAPLAEGVEDLAFEFGFDLDGSGAPGVYRAGLSAVAGQADNNWSNLVGIHVYMLTRSSDSTPGFSSPRTYEMGLAGTRGPFTDNFKRRMYVMTSRLNNVAGPREVP